MPFVNELIPADKYDFVDGAGFRNICGRDYKLPYRRASNWTIDRDRNYFVIKTGGGGGPSFGSPYEVSFRRWMDSENV